MGNKSLNRAKDAKEDEYYTKLSDIENELKHYKKHFKDKTILCNCDDPYESNFFKYFAMNFNVLGLKKLICTCYAESPIIYTQLSLFGEEEEYGRESKGTPYVIQITKVEDYNGDGAIDLQDVEQLLRTKAGRPRKLKGNGDFRSDECLEYLKEADIVVTNPPFSLLRDYIDTLMKYSKSFLIIGTQNALHYKEVFPLIRDNRIWVGYNHVKEFIRPDKTIKKFGNIIWYTNLDIEKRHEDIILYKYYSEKEYPKYENFDAIDVGRVSDIPLDYFGMMGVPDSFLDIYNPDEFELVGIGSGYLGQSIGVGKIKPEHKIQMTSHAAAGDIYYLLPNGKPKIPYSRIIIRRKQNGNQT